MKRTDSPAWMATWSGEQWWQWRASTSGGRGARATDEASEEEVKMSRASPLGVHMRRIRSRVTRRRRRWSGGDGEQRWRGHD
jgi:hypothetical protein